MHPLATDEFSKAIKQVQQINGEIKIFEPDDPHVTGKFSQTMPYCIDYYFFDTII